MRLLCVEDEGIDVRYAETATGELETDEVVLGAGDGDVEEAAFLVHRRRL